MQHDKPVIRYFVSYAHDDNDLKEKLLNPLKQQLAAAQDYCFEAWDGGEILTGERWHEQIQAAVARCQFGLLLVSPAFLGSAYIKDHELPAFVASNRAAPESEKRAIPVALKPIPFDNSIDLKGLEELQVFRDSAGKAFHERRNDKTREDFSLELFQQILKIVKHAIRREKILQKVFEKNPKNITVARKLIKIYLYNNNHDAAAQVYDTLLNVDPENLDLIEEKAALYKDIDKSRYVKTLEQAEKIRTRNSFLENLGKPITVKSIEISDLDFFGDFIWGFQAGVNVLLGKNGYGKSHLLRALVAMLQKEEHITQVFFQNSRKKASIRVEIEKDGTSDSTVRTLLIFEKSFGKIPVLAIPDMRYIEKSGDSIGAPNDKMTDLKSQSAWHFMHEASYEGLITKFLYDLCLDYLDKKTLDLPVFRLMEEVVGKLDRTKFKFHDIRRVDSARFQILVMTDGNEHPLPLQRASQGTLSVLAMFGMIYRYLKVIYAETITEDKLSLQRAIVVIDEIDAHLHPSWQQKVLQLLCDTFPNVQFIVTSHSPLVIAGRKKGEVAVLRKIENRFSVNVLDDHFIGATSLDIYSRIFDVEEKDETYLRLNTLASGKAEIEKLVSELEAQETLTPQQQEDLDKLNDQLYYLREFETVRDQKQKEENLKDENNKLTLEIMQLRGEANRLRHELAEHKQKCSELDIPSTVDEQPQAVEDTSELTKSQS